MKRKTIFRVVFAVIIGSLCMLQCIWPIPISSANDGIVVIVNKGISESSIDKAELKNIFLGKVIRWDDNKKIVLATLKRGDVHEQFLKDYVDRTKSQYKNHFKSLLFAGKGKMPKAFSSEKSLINFVANTDGAIGYVSSSSASEDVKIIKIN